VVVVVAGATAAIKQTVLRGQASLCRDPYCHICLSSSTVRRSYSLPSKFAPASVWCCPATALISAASLRTCLLHCPPQAAACPPEAPRAHCSRAQSHTHPAALTGTQGQHLREHGSGPRGQIGRESEMRLRQPAMTNSTQGTQQQQCTGRQTYCCTALPALCRLAMFAAAVPVLFVSPRKSPRSCT